MYKLLLCQRYLRTRYIALASIISVTLGVATMIVVNSVMAGFKAEMYDRMHDILSDIVIESQSLSGIAQPRHYEHEIREVLGDDLVGYTETVTVPAMLNYSVNGQWISRPVTVIGVDPETYASVGDFGKFLLNPANREKLSFLLRDTPFDAANHPQLADAGWPHRRQMAAWEQARREQQAPMRGESPTPPVPMSMTPQPETAAERGPAMPESALPAEQAAVPPPVIDPEAIERFGPPPAPLHGHAETGSGALATAPQDALAASYSPADPFAGLHTAEAFDPATDQHPGIVLGIAIGSVRHRTAEGQVEDYFLVVPGDDVKLTFPNTSLPPQFPSATFTVVDLYESKMVEHDSSFVFVPLDKLQELRGMIDPATGEGAVTTIQLRLREGADLEACRDKLRERFPATQYPIVIQTWKELQGPLLQAVQMETTILNILLFLIIAVAGFGILATFFMIVVEKTRDIGILKALGAPRRGVMSIFLGYGLSLGAVGAGVGLVLGLLFVVYINQIAGVVEWITGQEVFDPTIYYFQEIPTIINPFTIAWIAAGAMLIAVLASVLPALRAARLHPVQALRYE